MNYYTSIKIQKALTVKTSIYVAGQVAGGLIELNLGLNRPCGGYMDRLLIADDDDEKAPMNVYLFDSIPTAFADGVAFAPTIADLKKLAGFALLNASDYTTLNGNAIARLTFLVQSGFRFRTQDSKLYLYLVPSGTPTYTAASDLTVTAYALVEV